MWTLLWIADFRLSVRRSLIILNWLHSLSRRKKRKKNYVERQRARRRWRLIFTWHCIVVCRLNILWSSTTTRHFSFILKYIFLWLHIENVLALGQQYWCGVKKMNSSCDFARDCSSALLVIFFVHYKMYLLIFSWKKTSRWVRCGRKYQVFLNCVYEGEKVRGRTELCKSEEEKTLIIIAVCVYGQFYGLMRWFSFSLAHSPMYPMECLYVSDLIHVNSPVLHSLPHIHEQQHLNKKVI